MLNSIITVVRFNGETAILETEALMLGQDDSAQSRHRFLVDTEWPHEYLDVSHGTLNCAEWPPKVMLEAKLRVSELFSKKSTSYHNPAMRAFLTAHGHVLRE